MEPPRIFFAYPSQPPLRAETIARAAAQIALSGDALPVMWEDLADSGHLIINEILSTIDTSSLSVFDVTSLNQNVLFELGYAIGSRSRVWLVRDTSHEEEERRWKRFGLLKTVTYIPYTNSDELVGAFVFHKPHQQGAVLHSQLIGHSLEQSLPTSLFYMKSLCDTDVSRALSRQIDAETVGLFSVVVADPGETSFQPLTWYAQTLYNTRSAILHFTGPARRDADIHNSRCALLAGLATGMGKPVLMLAEEDYSPPIDYQDLLHIYATAKQCVRAVNEFLPRALATPARPGSTSPGATALALAGELKTLRLGSHIAEDERDTLADYFVDTGCYREVLAGATTVFVGRKGTGKTAILIRAADVLAEDRRNLVCVIKPPAYELDGVLRLLDGYREKAAQGYLIESLWKFLIYSEIARNAADEIRSRLAPPLPTSPEGRLLQMADDRDGVIYPDFAVRLERAVGRLLSVSHGEGVEAGRQGIAEALHHTVLRDLRELLGEVLTGRHRIAILVDNLDKAWERNRDLDELSMFLLGLLTSIEQIVTEFAKRDRWREPINVSLAVFLRSDIYARILDVAKERDKLPVTELVWSDPELLLRVIEGRYAASKGNDVAGAELWEKYFSPAVSGVDTRQWLLQRVMPRPRDLVFACNAAITYAANREHPIVGERDISDGFGQYSQFAVESVIVEGETSMPGVEALIYELVGGPPILLHEDLVVAASHIPELADRVEAAIEYLRRLLFIGIETREGQYAFPVTEGEWRRSSSLADHLSKAKRRPPRYEIHPAFWPYLELDAPGDPSSFAERGQEPLGL